MKEALAFMLPLLTVISAGVRYPVILVPGDGGSQLYVKLNKTSSQHWYCEKSTGGEYVSIWLNLGDLIPPITNCFVENMQLYYDNQTRTTHARQGVDIKTLPLGDPESVEWLDPSNVAKTLRLTYFHEIAEDLVAAGFVRNVSIRGAPFDFRKAPNELGTYFKNLKQLVEETFVLNNNTKCVFVAHSLGNPTLLYFLNQQTQAWKDKYIQGFVSLAGVWAGSIKILKVFASGDNLGVVTVSPKTVRPEQRAASSLAFMLPTDKYWTSDEPLVITDSRNYTVANYKQFFTDIKYMNGWEMYQDTKDLIRDLVPPNVPMHCVYGIGISTPTSLVYKKGDFPDTLSGELPGSGDGTVNQRSLEACLDWQGKQKYKVEAMRLQNVEHTKILADAQARKYVVQVATGQL